MRKRLLRMAILAAGLLSARASFSEEKPGEFRPKASPNHASLGQRIFGGATGDDIQPPETFPKSEALLP